LKSKATIFLLVMAIALYILSAFFYSYEASSQGLLPFINYPFKDLAIFLAVVASALLVIAAILYVKRK